MADPPFEREEEESFRRIALDSPVEEEVEVRSRLTEEDRLERSGGAGTGRAVGSTNLETIGADVEVDLKVGRWFVEWEC